MVVVAGEVTVPAEVAVGWLSVMGTVVEFAGYGGVALVVRKMVDSMMVVLKIGTSEDSGGGGTSDDSGGTL